MHALINYGLPVMFGLSGIVFATSCVRVIISSPDLREVMLEDVVYEDDN
jgi:hypothetical protein